MSDALNISAEWEVLENGSDEDRSTFAALGIAFNNHWLTEAGDTFAGRVRQKVHLSAYRLAEWLVWNWWRLRWEPRGNSTSWRLAHRTASIGGGYVWPDITFISDGERIIVDAKPTESRPTEPLRYIRDLTGIVPARDFERATDAFIQLVRAKLSADQINDSNLERIWTDLVVERSDPEVSKRRKLEALLGAEPDEADEATIERLVVEASQLGESAVQELAADADINGPPTATDIETWARERGHVWQPRDAVRLHDQSERTLPTNVAAWKRGAAAAHALRDQEQLGNYPISNALLCKLVGTLPAVIGPMHFSLPLSFALDGLNGGALIALKSKHISGRRFGLARILGDTLATSAPGSLIPATEAATYRQKVQRSFAAELLCPFDALREMLRGDYYSEDAIVDAADYFSVSTWTIRTILANHGLIGSDDITATA